MQDKDKIKKIPLQESPNLLEPTDESEDRLTELRRKRRLMTMPSAGALAGRRSSSQVLQDISKDMSFVPQAMGGLAQGGNTIANLARGLVGVPEEKPYGYLHGQLVSRIERGESPESLLPAIQQAAKGGVGYEFTTTTDFMNLAKELEEVLGRERADKLAREATQKEFANDVAGLPGPQLESVMGGRQLPLKSPQEIQKALLQSGMMSGEEMLAPMPGRQVPPGPAKPAQPKPTEQPKQSQAPIPKPEPREDYPEERVMTPRDRLQAQLEKRAYAEPKNGILEIIATALGGALSGFQGNPQGGIALGKHLSGEDDRKSAESALAALLNQGDRNDIAAMRAADGESPSVERGRQLRNAKTARSMSSQSGRRRTLEKELDLIGRNPVEASSPQAKARLAEILKELYAMDAMEASK